MGIPKFAYFITKRYPLIIKKIKEEVDIPEIDNLYLDINGIIHNVSHGNSILIGCQNRKYEDIYSDVCDTIDKLLKLIKPKKLLMISADGVAPRAKMNQQRVRRFRKEPHISVEDLKIIEENNIDISKQFNSDAISAGTELMYNLSKYMKDYIIKKKKEDKLWSNINVLFTGSDVPGEGEHKILEYIRNFKLSKEYTSNTRHCIYGLDADLVMLSLISHECNVVILREDTILRKKKEKLLKKKGIILQNSNDKNEEPYEFFLISVLREYLELEFYDLRKKLKFKFNMERILDDFIFLCFFIGNDFLPNLYSFSIETGCMDYLFDFYKDCLPDLDDYITEQGKIDFNRAKKIFKLLSYKEKHSFEILLQTVKDTTKKNKTKRAEIMKEQILILKKAKIRKKKEKLINDLTSKTAEEQKAFKINKKHKEITKIKEIFEKISNKLNKNYKFDEEFSKYKQNPNCYEERKEEKATQALVDIFGGSDDEEEENKKKKKKIIIIKKEETPVVEDYKPVKKKLTIDSTINEVLSEALDYEKYMNDPNYCSDFSPNDVDDSDVSDIDIKSIMDELATSINNNINNQKEEKAEDINQEFNEKLVKNYVNAEQAKEFYYKEKLHIDIKTEEGQKEKQKLFISYLEGLQWVLYYYYRGIKSWKWYYPYHYAPMISDFDNVEYDNEKIQKLFENDDSKPFSPFQSLLFILPKTSFDLLPECYKDFPNQAPEYFPEKVDIDYNGKHTSWEAVYLLPFLDEKKVLELESKNRKLNAEEEKHDKWGESLMFNKNQLGSDASFNVYEIYQNKNFNLLSNYDVKRVDCSFPTLKTLDYDYSLNFVKQYFGTTIQKTKRITIIPILREKLNDKQIQKFLFNKTIFVDYPYKSLARLQGIVFQRKYYYLYKDQMFIDSNYRYSNDLVDTIIGFHERIGITLNHPDILCNIARFKGFKNVNGKMRRDYEENSTFYVPFETSSLNSTNDDFEQFKYHFNYEYVLGLTKEKEKFKGKGKEQNNNNNNEEREKTKYKIKKKGDVDNKFKKYPSNLRVDQKKKSMIISIGPINQSEYRQERKFQNEKLEPYQIYYYKNPNNKKESNLNNPYLIIK